MTVPSERARDALGEISGSIDLSEELKELDEIINFAANGKTIYYLYACILP